ncbi:MAG TPA: cytochrome c oxidase accessory protein CcoG [Pseudomonadales bacterium]|nr:cytochrome c oxidase accessory protein CcoG [Pseudomonadales bacterium]HRG49874.1 cytochrome c oxidase accessory protein CcoG [Pseudomonadales bacterium]
MSSNEPERISAVNEYAPKEVAELDLYQKREKIYTRSIEGFFQRIRLFTGWPLLVGYFFLPWTQWHGHQTVLFDLPARKFYIFDLVFWPQDLVLLAWTLIIAAFALFFFTSLFGRIWCGYSCPQTVWTSIFMWMEQKAEGSRNQRIKLDQAPWAVEKILRKGAKHAMWVAFAFLTGFTFIGYFTPITDLTFDFFTGNADLTVYGWIGLFAFMTYLNAGWLREQVCLYMCPYARFQAAMFDSDTLTVTYDQLRGEPRGARRVNEGEKPQNLGDCIDCMLCVQVCPTGIDIRDGLQYECINCALCIDACNAVMEKVGYAPNLIAYSSESRVEGKKFHWLRLRTVGYGSVLLIMCALFIGALVLRETTDLKILRERNALYQLRNGNIENVYTIKIGNRDRNAHQYTLSVDEKNIQFMGETAVRVESGEELSVPVRLSLPANAWRRRSFDVKFNACLADTAEQSHCITQESRFTGPIQ